MNNTIVRQQVSIIERINHTAAIFGINFTVIIEPSIYAIASNIAEDYNGAYWEFYSLSNGGFYMVPYSKADYQVECENGFEGMLTADALGVTACLYAYSHLSFSSNVKLAEMCAGQYHLLRAYMYTHKESASILSAID